MQRCIRCIAYAGGRQVILLDTVSVVTDVAPPRDRAQKRRPDEHQRGCRCTTDGQAPLSRCASMGLSF